MKGRVTAGMKKARAVYLETTIVSYYVARPSRDLISAARQQLTREWWENERGKYTLVISPVVLAEAEAGDPDAARKRLDALAGCVVLNACEEIDLLADRNQTVLGIPEPRNSMHFILPMPYFITFHTFSHGTARTLRIRKSS